MMLTAACCRAYIAMGNHFLVIQKIRDSDPVSLQAVKQLALYMQVSLHPITAT